MTQNTLLHPQRLSDCLSFCLFSLFSSRSLRDWGVSCNLRVGFSLSCTNTCSVISISLSSGNFIPISSLGRSPGSSLSLVLCSHGLRLSAGFPAHIVCVFAACLWRGSSAGRKAGWWPLRSVVTQVRCKRCPWGACVSLPLWNAKEHQFSVLALPSLTNSCSTLWQRVISLSARMWAYNRQKKWEKSLLYRAEFQAV